MIHKEDIKTLSNMRISDTFFYLPIHALAVANARVIYTKDIKASKKTNKVIYDNIPENW